MDETAIYTARMAHQESPNENVFETVPCTIDDFVAETSDDLVGDNAQSAINDFVVEISAEDAGTVNRDASMPPVAI